VENTGVEIPLWDQVLRAANPSNVSHQYISVGGSYWDMRYARWDYSDEIVLGSYKSRRHAYVRVDRDTGAAEILRNKLAKDTFTERLGQLPVIGPRFTFSKGLWWFQPADNSPKVPFEHRLTTNQHGTDAVGDVQMQSGALNKRAVTRTIKSYVATALRAYLVSPPTFAQLMEWRDWWVGASTQSIWNGLAAGNHANCWYSDFTPYKQHAVRITPPAALEMIVRLAPNELSARVDYFNDTVSATLGDALHTVLESRLASGDFVMDAAA
jgi:hypothetical protein